MHACDLPALHQEQGCASWMEARLATDADTGRITGNPEVIR
jgi:hypothetical protein